MLSNPPSTGDAALDDFLRSVKRHIDDALRPADGWRLSDLSADVSEVISDKRDLIDIVTRYDDINDLKDSVDLTLADYAAAIADFKALGNQYQDHAEIFSQTMEWWSQNRKIIEDASQAMAATILASGYADAAEASALRAGSHEEVASKSRDEAVSSASSAASSASAAATSEANADESENVALDASAAAIAAAISVTGGPRSAKIHVYDGSGTPSLDNYLDAQVGDIIERLSDGERWKVEQ